MAGLVFGCIAPHGRLLIPPIGGAEGQKALATRAALTELGRRLATAEPDTIVLVTPHGRRVDGTFSLLHSARVAGQLGGNGTVVSVEFRVDRALNDAIAETAAAHDTPVSRIVQGSPDSNDSCIPLDWGAVVPFWFLGRTLTPKPRVVVASPDHRIDLAHFPRFGAAVRQAAEQLGRRIAFIASADLGHAHDPNGPYGYDPAAAEFDAATRDAVAANDLGRLLTFDPGWVERAKPDALWQILNLHGALAGTPLRGELLSYEVPTYFGMLCAAYA